MLVLGKISARCIYSFSKPINRSGMSGDYIFIAFTLRQQGKRGQTFILRTGFEPDVPALAQRLATAIGI
jgi:hypothetical protein